MICNVYWVVLFHWNSSFAEQKKKKIASCLIFEIGMHVCWSRNVHDRKGGPWGRRAVGAGAPTNDWLMVYPLASSIQSCLDRLPLTDNSAFDKLQACEEVPLAPHKFGGFDNSHRSWCAIDNLSFHISLTYGPETHVSVRHRMITYQLHINSVANHR